MTPPLVTSVLLRFTLMVTEVTYAFNDGSYFTAGGDGNTVNGKLYTADGKEFKLLFTPAAGSGSAYSLNELNARKHYCFLRDGSSLIDSGWGWLRSGHSLPLFYDANYYYVARKGIHRMENWMLRLCTRSRAALHLSEKRKRLV